jgi:hypothetical protein
MKSIRAKMAVITVFLAVQAVSGQTKVDLATQSKRVDFTGASVTKPIRTAASLPSSCVSNEVILIPGASAGGKLYVCNSSGAWEVQGGGSGGGGAVRPGSIGGVLVTTSGTETALDIDTAFLMTAGGNNSPTGNMTPSTGIWNLSGATALIAPKGTAEPATCSAGQVFLNTNAPGRLRICTSTNVWADAVPVPLTTLGDLLTYNGGALVRQAAGTKGSVLAADSGSATGLRWLPGVHPLRTKTSGTTSCPAGPVALETYTIPAGTLEAGDVIEVRAWWRKTGTAGPGSFSVVVGSTQVGPTLSFSASDVTGSTEVSLATVSSGFKGVGRNVRGDGSIAGQSATTVTATPANAVTVSLMGASCTGGDQLGVDWYDVTVKKNANY